MDIGMLLFASGLRIMESLITKWVEQKQAVLRMKEIDKQIAAAAKTEADQVRVRVDDLEAETKRIRDILFSEIPEFSIGKRLNSKELKINYDPNAAKSVNQLMDNLRLRIKELEESYRLEPTNGNGNGPDVANNVPEQTEFVPVTTPAESSHESTATKLLRELKQKINESEMDRQ